MQGKAISPGMCVLSALDLMADTNALHKNGPVLMMEGKVVCIKIIREQSDMINGCQVLPFCRAKGQIYNNGSKTNET